MRMKRPAEISIGCDLDTDALAQVAHALGLDPLAGGGDATGGTAATGDGRRRGSRSHASIPLTIPDRASPEPQLLERAGVYFIDSYSYSGRRDELVYCDPPYVRSSRRSTRDMYKFEMTDADHAHLLDVITHLPCLVMISGYRTPMYDRALAGWHSISYQAVTRGGPIATEYLWFNFPPPVSLHDYRYLGTNFRERERIKRKKARWVARLKNMPTLERHALMDAIETAWDTRHG